MEIDIKNILAMPKTDLHVHLDGSVRVATVLELAKKNKVELPTTDQKQLQKILVPGLRCNNLVEYLGIFEIILSVLQEEEALARVAFELAEDAAEENVRYMEVRYSPALHTNNGMELATIVDAVLDGLGRAERRHNIKTGIIVCGIRERDPETSLSIADLAVDYKNRGVVGFDLAGDEQNYSAEYHLKAFDQIKRNNINSTLHAGEAGGPESIHQALHYCGAHRIGHGTRLKEDMDLLNYVNDHRVPLEVCLTSNIQTKVTPSYGEHPFKYYYDRGLRVTINTDNRLLADTSVTHELYLAAKHFNLGLDDVKKIILSGFKSAFMPAGQKADVLAEVSKELEKF